MAPVDEIISRWKDKPREVAKTVMEKYGPPDEATDSMLIWHSNGPWKRTIVYRDEVKHNFPKQHTDIMEQFIDYQVPEDKFDDIARFDGSVYPDRTKGEVSAKCDREEANFLSLNLVNDIVNGKTTVEDARQAYAENMMALMTKRPGPYVQDFQFEIPRGRTGDPDESIIGQAMMEEVKEEAEEAVEKIRETFG